MAPGGLAAKDATGIAQNPLFAKLCSDLEGAPKTPKTPKTPAGSVKDFGARNKDLQKTKMCVYHLQGKCGLQGNCQFAHNASELRNAPNLMKTGLCTNFMNGNCTKTNCSYAHGEAELVKPPSYKKKPCVWFAQGKCRNGSNCGFIHDSSELGGEGAWPKAKETNFKPWKSEGSAVDCDASTAAPPNGSPQTGSPQTGSPQSGSPRSQKDTDVTMMATMPDEHLFRMMAGRGSAPLQQQVKSMGLAIGELQAKLCQVQVRQQAASNVIEGAALQKQVDEMQSAICQLSKQCQGMEVGMQLSSLRTNQQPPPTTPHPSSKASTLRQKVLGPDDSSDAVGSAAFPPLAKKAHPAAPAQSSYVKHLSRKDHRPVKTSAKHSFEFEMRVAMGVLVVAIMVMVEVGLR